MISGASGELIAYGRGHTVHTGRGPAERRCQLTSAARVARLVRAAILAGGGGDTVCEGDRQDDRSVICLCGATGVVSGECPAEIPESVVDAVLPGIRGTGHAAGKPGVVVPAPLRRGILFAICSLTFAYKGRVCRMAGATMAGNAI
ncbi:hypothetical protein PU13_02795 [Escherichia coli]|nr:hypothetical protein PU13_02795 [Escherichia coli]